MPKRVEIIEERVEYKKAIFQIIEAKLRYEDFAGNMTPAVTRLNLERGDAVAAIIHDPVADTILLVEQFRYPTYQKTADGRTLELPAGIVESGEDPENTMIREIEEETGDSVSVLHHIYTFFLSPGGSSERVFLYYGRLDHAKKINSGDDVQHRQEYIRTHQITVGDAVGKLHNNEYENAMTIIAMQWLDMNRLRLDQL